MGDVRRFCRRRSGSARRLGASVAQRLANVQSGCGQRSTMICVYLPRGSVRRYKYDFFILYGLGIINNQLGKPVPHAQAKLFFESGRVGQAGRACAVFLVATRLYSTRSMARGYVLAIPVATSDHEVDGGLLRIGSWSNMQTHAYPIFLHELPSLCESLRMRRGEMLIRDVRACHGGSAHAGQLDRPLPGIQIYCTPNCQGTCFRHACIGEDAPWC